MDLLTVKDALPVFYKDYHLGPDGGIQSTTVKVRLLKNNAVYFPNFKARKKLVFKHDVHHLLTGYSAKMKGETEISAWELATGCRHNWFAFVINTYGMMAGFPFNTKGIWKAWLRGQYSSNLYHKQYTDAQLLLKNVLELKKELGLAGENTKKANPFFATLTFTGFIFFGIVFSLASVALIPFITGYSLYTVIRQVWQQH